MPQRRRAHRGDSDGGDPAPHVVHLCRTCRVCINSTPIVRCMEDREVVENYLNGGRWTLVAEFTEIESGKRNDRPELGKALSVCKKQKAKLVIAKLRLKRCLAGLASAAPESVVAGAHKTEVTRLQITDEGGWTLAEAKP